ncbi:MAG: hypothetical protein GWO20_15790 [Candidatus Korarchaeota archaeon]|nr:hypothetical protein [Candidatus Korarchaeota archaeon]NIU84933.1 hypothetical protein [Candidatus Thorarchaeota archaeon]NIW14950.1 hypothetical protein [Candidatus Thorarchaeota archaeon]NIW52917.1 hypothetical protein [Candidatus Korarchaeota archaeon]
MQKSRIELTIGILGLVCYVLFLFLGLSRVSLIFGFIFGVWIITRGSEVAVEGLKDTSIHVGMREYDAGVLSSLASNFP